MLRYFYLFSLLLVCINWCFCYDYISHSNFDEADGRLENKHNLVYEREEDQEEVKNDPPVYDGLEGDDHLAEIDVLSFILEPEYNSNKENGFHGNRRSPKQGSFSKPEGRAKRRQLNWDSLYNNQPENIEITLDQDPKNNEIQSDPVTIMKQEKKKPLKIPFFSPNKFFRIGKKKKKKAKKRIVCFRCTAKPDLSSSGYIAVMPSLEAVYATRNIKPNDSPTEVKEIDLLQNVPNKMYHNSRQYYQDNPIQKEKLPSNNKYDDNEIRISN